MIQVVVFGNVPTGVPGGGGVDKRSCFTWWCLGTFILLFMVLSGTNVKRNVHHSYSSSARL